MNNTNSKKLVNLKRNTEFRRVYKYGYSAADKYLVIYKLKSGSDLVRVGFTISKKLGKAVVRNKIKRKLKEICRLNVEKFDAGYDYVIIARIPARECTYKQLEYSVFNVLKKLKKNRR
ncbi:ribonuclease P protein component [Desulfohalotomaculum tongense]|uniref:ribonuclease P protein component n=1 Tax=Desulforadius tongensis TaxID=1216062 RepID=UPI001956E29B|nr:ribonuclease P protein component [Desulforadius tongensis]MBM7855828.1 ribonuclease P protein component [Desulforadius tongensis]